MVRLISVSLVLILSLTTTIYASDLVEDLMGEVYNVALGEEISFELETENTKNYVENTDYINAYSNNINILKKYLSDGVYEIVYEKVKNFVNSYKNGMFLVEVSPYIKRDNGIYTFYIRFDYGWIYEIVATEDKLIDFKVSSYKNEDLLYLEGTYFLDGLTYFNISYLEKELPNVYSDILKFFNYNKHIKILGLSDLFGISDYSYCFVIVGKDIYKIGYTKSRDDLDIRKTKMSSGEAYILLYKDEREPVD